LSREIDIAGQVYLVSKFSSNQGAARKQFHVLRRLAPAITSLGPLLAAHGREFFGPDETANTTDEPATNGNDAEPEALKPGEVPNALIDAIGVLVDAIGRMDDATADYVIDNCLDAVKFKTGGAWQNLRASNGRLMYAPADDLMIQMQLVWAVLQENLASFSLAGLFSNTESSQPPAPGLLT
jgi:hypothetical protein